MTNKPVRPFYTVSQLMKMMHYKSKQGCANALASLNIPHSLIGRKKVYFLSDIQTYCPPLFNSITEANQLNIRFDIEPETNDEDYSLYIYRDSLKV
jgi:hypothetical protein